ncbi:MAG TPA: BtpA/SgcQ family protein [Sandaracinaceae bacterium LLY-WYZ-13_1]|nr:BtpA/SgcQ family protein [Sandaracinaceae bacterium LLY-WYZ-13_1]
MRGLIGVVHLPAMPGDPQHREGGFAEVIEAARRDAAALAEGGVEALIVENFGSAPFPKGTPEQPTPPHQIAALALAVDACRRESDRPVGVNVLRNDARAALGVAAATGAVFVRVNVHVGAYVTDQGVIEGRAFETLRERRVLGVERVAILADVRVKHAAPLAEAPIEDEVRDALHRGLADAVVVSGAGTGEPVERARLEAVRAAAGDAVVLVGSGLTPERAESLAPLADGAIVGTWLKVGGDVRAPVDAARVRTLADAVRGRWRPTA